MAVRKLEHVGIMVENLEESISFYRDIIGLDVIKRMKHSKPGIELVFLGLEGEILVELVAGHNRQLAEEGKVNHVAFTVDDLSKEIQELKNHSVLFVEDEVTSLPDGSQYIFFYGPDRERIEYFQPGTPK